MDKNTEELCDKVLAARTHRDELKSKVDEADAALQELESQLTEAVAGEKGAKVKHGGFTFSSATKVSWKTNSDSKDRLLSILKEGVPELVKESVNASSLSSYLRKNEDSLEEDAPSWWASAKECLSRSEATSLSVRKAPAKKKK